jgi:2-polyprenyl-3-methyl-5-hydroxy-6-metoxy-1,4-benzoquinol methylase
MAAIWRQKVGFNPFSSLDESCELKKLLCMGCGLAHYSPQIIGDHTLYNKLSKFDWYYPKNKWEFDFAVRLLKRYKPNSVLEVGCGAGEFLHRLSSCVDRVVGVDINERAIAAAISKGLDVSNQSLAAMTETFDMIFMFQVLEHLEAPGAFVSDLVGRINPGGYLVLAVPNPDGYMKEVEVVFLDMPPHHSTCWSEEALENLAAAHGLSKVCYATEPMNLEYLRAQLFAQIDQNRTWRTIKFVQKVVVLALLPMLYMAKNGSQNSGQTHLIVLKKNAAG